VAATGVLGTLGFAAGASLPLLAGAVVGVAWRPPRRVVATILAFAAGALISAVSFELFEETYTGGGALRAGLGFAGATQQLALPLAFAAGAVLASVIDTLAPDAFHDGGPVVALASAVGFFTAFVLSV
jgi:zinc transporter ZupT